MKTVLITGAFGGMGKATTELLSKAGYTVFALDVNVEDSIEKVVPIKVDITDEESVKSAFEYVNASVDRLDAIIHFAGMYCLDSLVEIDNEKLKKIFNVNFYGAYLVNKTFLPLLDSGSKIIITTSELAPLDPLPFTGIYAVTKSALDKYAYSLRMELQLLDINVSVIRAGAVKTSMLGVSTNALDEFCKKTKLYKCNAKRFKNIIESVEAKNISPLKIAKLTNKILNKKKPKFAYKINRNFLLRLLNFLPSKMQFSIIAKILKSK